MRVSAVAHLHVIAQQCADPTQAARAMVMTGNKHLKCTKKTIAVNTLDRLCRKQVGTNEGKF